MVFTICEDELYTKTGLEECVFEKLTLIPDHTKLVVTCGPRDGWKHIDELPKALRVRYHSSHTLPFFTRMIEIFNKRWQTLDLISMMQELKRATNKDFQRRHYPAPYMSIKDSLSTLPTFQKKEEEHSS